MRLCLVLTIAVALMAACCILDGETERQHAATVASPVSQPSTMTVRELPERSRLNCPDEVRGLSFSPNGKLLAACGIGFVRVWKWDPGELIGSFGTEQDRFRWVGFRPDSKTVLAGSEGTLHIATLDGRSQPTTVEASPLATSGPAFRRLVPSASVSQDGNQILVGMREGKVALWDMKRSKLLGTFYTTDAEVEAVAISPDGAKGFCITRGTKSYLYVWGLAKMNEERRLRLKGYVSSAAFFSDGTRAVVSDGASVRVLNISDGSVVKEYIDDPTARVFCVAASADGKQLLSASAKGDFRKLTERVVLWDTRTGQKLAWSTGKQELVMAVAFSPDGQLAASGGMDGSVIVWDLGKLPK